jgi:superfamily II DNA helicase RecQ
VNKAFTDWRKSVKDFGSTRPPNDVIAEGSIERLSVILTVEPRAPQPWAQLIAWLYERQGRIGIVYAPNRSTGLIVADRLSAIGMAAEVHSGQKKPITVLTSGRRGEYASRELDFIVHMFPPASLEDFRDDLGAAGSSRNVTISVVFHHPDDASQRDNPYGGDAIGGASRPLDLDSVMAFLQTKTCRHRFLMHHFTSSFSAPQDTDEPCGRCDNCLGRRYYPGDDVRSAPT